MSIDSTRSDMRSAKMAAMSAIAVRARSDPTSASSWSRCWVISARAVRAAATSVRTGESAASATI